MKNGCFFHFLDLETGGNEVKSFGCYLTKILPLPSPLSPPPAPVKARMAWRKIEVKIKLIFRTICQVFAGERLRSVRRIHPCRASVWRTKTYKTIAHSSFRPIISSPLKIITNYATIIIPTCPATPPPDGEINFNSKQKRNSNYMLIKHLIDSRGRGGLRGEGFRRFNFNI
jgi:hypothetical protein